MGIEAKQRFKFNLRNLLIQSIFVYSFGAMIAFVLCESFTFINSSKAILGALTILLSSITLYSNVSKQIKIFDLIEKIETIVDKSKLKKVDTSSNSI